MRFKGLFRNRSPGLVVMQDKSYSPKEEMKLPADMENMLDLITGVLNRGPLDENPFPPETPSDVLRHILTIKCKVYCDYGWLERNEEDGSYQLPSIHPEKGPGICLDGARGSNR